MRQSVAAQPTSRLNGSFLDRRAGWSRPFAVVGLGTRSGSNPALTCRSALRGNELPLSYSANANYRPSTDLCLARSLKSGNKEQQPFRTTTHGQVVG